MIDRILDKIDEIRLLKPLCIVAIDGCGGAGKSTLAKHIVTKYGSGQIIHMDDFYKPSSKRLPIRMYDKEIAADYDIERLKQDVINPIISGEAASYQRYDWVSDDLTEWKFVQPNGLIIVEGIYSLSHELYSKYDIKIFVECKRKLRLKRGLERDGENALDIWEEWMIGEDKYLQEQKPHDKIDFMISGEEKY